MIEEPIKTVYERWEMEEKQAIWDAVARIARADRSWFLQEMGRLCESASALDRQIGLHLLWKAIVRIEDEDLRQRGLDLSLALLARESDVRCLLGVLFNLRQFGRPGPLEPLLTLLSRPDKRVRWSVTEGLYGRKEPAAIQALFVLLEDREPSVRDGAASGLARLVSYDSLELRAALHARLDDADIETRMWALLGLAVRRDRDTIDAIEREIARITDDPDADGYHCDMIREAVTLLPDPTYVPALCRYFEKHGAPYEVDDIEAVIALCENPDAGLPVPPAMARRGWIELGD